MLKEKFEPRGIGANWIACFVCGQGGYKLEEDGVRFQGSCQPDLAAHVLDLESGYRIVKTFNELKSRAYLDYRDYEPHHIQVKVGACEDHRPNLEYLMKSVRSSRNIITESIIRKALLFPQE